MSDALIKALRKENLCTYFILPLLKLSKISFVSSNFIDCYLQRTGRILAVKLYSPELLSRRSDVTGYLDTIQYDGADYVLYELAPHWQRDIDLFRAGKFSKMSDDAKRMIETYSGLAYKKPKRNGGFETDGRLLALTRDKSLRRFWELEMKVNLGDDDELLSIPGDESYVDWLPETKKHLP
jgi:hypothetical protein